MAETGVILLVHGSRGELGAPATVDTLKIVSNGLKAFLAEDVEIIGGAMQFNSPNLEEAATTLIANGAKTIVVAPYFLFPGRHIMEDIPGIVASLRQTNPHIEFIISENMGKNESFVELMAHRIVQAYPALLPNRSYDNLTPNDIEPLSMAIIEKLLPPLPTLSRDERTVVKRIVHTCGDVQIARLVRFSPLAISSAVSAIEGGSVIFTDVRMVERGISRTFLDTCSCSVTCALDSETRERVTGMTRTAGAIYNLENKLDGAIIAIGNAPTALLALLDMIDNRNVKPALVVGMPVGFVRAAESKAELISRDISYIAIEGTRGGSALAAATVNALMGIARDRRTSTAKMAE